MSLQLVASLKWVENRVDEIEKKLNGVQEDIRELELVSKRIDVEKLQSGINKIRLKETIISLAKNLDVITKRLDETTRMPPNFFEVLRQTPENSDGGKNKELGTCSMPRHLQVRPWTHYCNNLKYEGVKPEAGCSRHKVTLLNNLSSLVGPVRCSMLGKRCFFGTITKKVDDLFSTEKNL